MIVELGKLRRILKLHEVDLKNIEDEDLETLIDYKLSEIEALTGLRINPTPLSDDFNIFKGKSCALYDFPVRNIDQIKLNGRIIKDYNYKESGTVFFNQPLHGHLHVDYTVGLNNNDKKRYIEPLLIDMIVFFFKYGSDGGITSERELGVSVSYDVNSTLGHKVQKQLSHLKRMYNVRLRLI